MERISSGDRRVFETLYQETSQRVFFYLNRLLQDRSTAEDILVETFTQAWKNAHRFQGQSKASTWIFGIARNLALNELRKRKPVEDIEDHPELEEPGDPLQDMEAEDRKAAVRDALIRVSAKHREVLDLVFFHEMNYQEIAAILDVPLNTVKTRVFHAKKAVKKKLGSTLR